MPITASKLYDYLQCAHRPWRDAWGPQGEKNPETNPFVEMLWEKGTQYEKEVIGTLGEYFDASQGTQDERAQQTLEAMRRGEPLIYQGVLRFSNLIGIPDLLRRQPDGTYIPIDIKSGMGFEGASENEDGEEDEGKPKKHYAVQLALYLECLRGLGFATGYTGIIHDVDGKEVVYDLLAPQGPRTPETLWAFYERTRDTVAALLANEAQNQPAMVGVCKLCPWYSSCKKWVRESGDPTAVFYVGRSVRDTLSAECGVRTVEDMIALDPAEVMAQKKRDGGLKRISEKTIETMQRRARVLAQTKEPEIRGDIVFPNVPYELFFDIEDDPTRGFVYMHGVYERANGKERYLDFTAQEIGDVAEKDAWQRFWDYIRSLPPGQFAVYYYSHHERTTYRRLRRKYPDVVSEAELEAFFAPPNAIDLYTDVVLKQTDWPVWSYSIKEIAQYLGFRWRDQTPSGALSIQWFNEYIVKKDPAILKRILEYNEDDCKATMVLKDTIERLAAARVGADLGQVEK